MNDEYYMKLAIALARKGRFYVGPNPMVGAVIVKKGMIIGRGYHQRFGGNHAEINAIHNAGEDIAGSTLYVTLEPCCHEGKTPPCTDSIIKNKIARVVIGTIDSNPLVSCQGINYLQSCGIEVKTGVLENECRKLNEKFFHYMETGLPFVTVKYAQTLDGRIATATGESQWISSTASLKFAHQLRAEHDAILVGRKTVDKDNPELTVRLVKGRNPLRVIVDSELKISPTAKVLQNISKSPTLIATIKKPDDARFKRIAATGAEILSVKADKDGRVDLRTLFKFLAERKISSVLVEGGAQIITSVLKNNLANRIVTVIAPKIIGKGIEAVGDLNITNLDLAKILSIQKVTRNGNDIIIDSRLK
ncbi:MAG: bifunctional diaminohydroxyphosphoribosylaminopyrimidine deaminase/5-amino-6-(5-phosphoribosylamino)uracil reductase RibD [Smithella sp.]|jgi:diaminohydroxyphosphoribosylaminopyrimidine deaminase/5-amino-6-(5-phosphoribosylamino)uracil reductase|nr:bifunctional diaminohydroxyphosphoribosylaminopyrimidine deaminase/5-amino-6-(5-phosphoribosylamino)uracil reductase RibD [Smithella sp.]